MWKLAPVSSSGRKNSTADKPFRLVMEATRRERLEMRVGRQQGSSQRESTDYISQFGFYPKDNS